MASKTPKTPSQSPSKARAPSTLTKLPKGAKSKTLQDIGIDGLCERLRKGESEVQIARSLGISNSWLSEWINANPERSARAKAARMAAADAYADKAEQVLIEASDPFEIQKARELAHHYRWMAKTRDPRQYGDKQQVTQDVNVQARVVVVPAKAQPVEEEATAMPAPTAMPIEIPRKNAL